MSELTLESLTKRVEALEAALAAERPKRPRKGWRKVVGMFHDNELMRQVDEEGQKIREAEREAARHEEPAE